MERLKENANAIGKRSWQGLKSGVTLRHDIYRIDRVLGQDGFGITYLATDMGLGRKVSIKEFFPKDLCDRDPLTGRVTPCAEDSEALMAKLKNEFIDGIRDIAGVDYPGIARIHAIFEENDTAYYVNDYIVGRSLSELVRREGALPIPQAVGYVEKVGDALECLHSKKQCHNGIKPSDIIIRTRDDYPVLVDFGLSLSGYNQQSDVYSLATILYFLITGGTATNAAELLDEELPGSDSMPAAIYAAISKAISPQMGMGYLSVDQFMRDIKMAHDEVGGRHAGADNGHKWVDLGLPSGLKWAACNVGAAAPEEYGGYFAWGETYAKSENGYSKCIACDKSLSLLRSLGIIDSQGQLTMMYDAASVNLGEKWRMPTESEVEELINHCTWQPAAIRGIHGFRVSGSNGKSIFLPAAGRCNGDYIYDVGDGGFYWSASVGSGTRNACGFFFYGGNMSVDGNFRDRGFQVRPVLCQ